MLKTIRALRKVAEPKRWEVTNMVKSQGITSIKEDAPQKVVEALSNSRNLNPTSEN